MCSVCSFFCCQHNKDNEHTSNGHRDRDEEGDEDENEGSDEDEDEEKDDFFAVEIGAVATRTKPCKGSWAC